MDIEVNFQKTPAERRVAVWISPGESPFGVADVHQPTAAEINNTGDVSGMVPASQSISWSDMDFGPEASETTNEPSLADISSYEDFAGSTFGGSMSFFMPLDYDDNSNLHSVIYDITDEPGAPVDIVKRVDGDTSYMAPVADGDFVSVYQAHVNSEQNPFNIGESVRRTVGFGVRGDFSHYTIVGDHAITAVEPGAYAEGDTGRIRGVVQDRDYTNALDFTSSDPDVIEVTSGGFYRVNGTGAATVTIRDREAGTETTVSVTAA